MAAISEQARFLGVNWRSLWIELRKPWLNAHHWPLVVALTPSAIVRLLQTDGGESLWNVGADGAMRRHAAGNEQGRFIAIELPEDMVLRRSIALPVLSEVETRQAIEIEIESNNPFPAHDLRWGYKTLGASATAGQRVEAVMVSHRQVSALLVANADRFQSPEVLPEVWAGLGTDQYLLLNGYGEVRRVQFCTKGRRKTYGLVAVVAILLGAIAITPTVQLRARAIDAVNAYTVAHHRVAPLVREREMLVRATDQIQVLNTVVQQRADPVEVLDVLTRVLGDDTSLRSLQIQGLKVNLEGQTGNAAELMQLLGRQPGFRDVVAPTAATRPFGANKDNFKIEFTLEPRKMADLPPLSEKKAVVQPVSSNQIASEPRSTASNSTPRSTP